MPNALLRPLVVDENVIAGELLLSVRLPVSVPPVSGRYDDSEDEVI
jgi:hypothetical protein